MIMLGLLILIPVAFVPIFLMDPNGQRAGAYRDQLAVVRFDFSHRTAGSNLLVTVVGTLTNMSAITWKNAAVEARFFDKSGKLIDVIKAESYSGPIVPAHGEAAFKVESPAAKPATDYATCKATVKWASDVNWP